MGEGVQCWSLGMMIVYRVRESGIYGFSVLNVDGALLCLCVM